MKLKNSDDLLEARINKRDIEQMLLDRINELERKIADFHKEE